MPMSLTKDHIVNSIHNQLGVPKTQSIGFLEAFFETMKKTLESGEDVLITGFGKFSVKEKTERRGRNPQTGNGLVLDARRVVLFRCSSKLKEKLNGKG